MVRFKATKEIDIQKINAVLTLQVLEKRPDIVWLLENLKNWGLSKGETENIIRYLEYLNLLDNGALNKTAKEAIETKKVMIPESGLYEIAYIIDKVVGHKIVDFKRIKADKELDGNVEEFVDYKLFDGKFFETWGNKKTKFHIRFERQKRQNPRIIIKDTETAILTIEYSDEGHTKLSVKSKSGKYHFVDEKFGNLDLERNLEYIIENWDKEFKAELVSFEDVKDKPSQLEDFKMMAEFRGQSLYLRTEVDEGDYKVEISDIPILPKNEIEARKWLIELIKRRLDENKGYFTYSYIEQLENKILKEKPLSQKYPNIFITGNEFHSSLEESSEYDLIRNIQAAKDLSIEINRK